MTRRLLLGIIVLFCSMAFLAGNLWAASASSKSTAKTKKQAELKPYSGLAKALKATQKKSLKTAKLNSKKKTSSVKSTHKTGTSKKTVSVNTRSPHKASYLNSKPQHKATRYKKRTAQQTQPSSKHEASGGIGN
ncbi:MAG: hypothetical protein HY913_01095 [Desulfomonile tiedjei]|nr:hypothetical protein [Desulfomonile tiedjei]